MKFLYLILDLGSLLVPFIFTFHPKIKFYKEWKTTIPAIIISAIIFIIWDINFTLKGVWGFNSKYLIGIEFFKLPLEEILFFFCIPYACLFTHFSLKNFNTKNKISSKLNMLISILVSLILFCCAIIFIELDYTFYNFIICSGLIMISLFLIPNELSHFYKSFLVILIPFFIVNGVLTGSIIAEEVVWYNNDENLGIRLATIPIEDIVYALNILILPLLLKSGLIKLIFLPEMVSKYHQNRKQL